MSRIRLLVGTVAALCVVAAVVLPMQPAGAGGGGAPSVALLFDPAYVDVNREADNARLALEALGAEINLVETIAPAAWTAALEGADVLVLGELEDSDEFVAALSAEAVEIISNWVEAGGRIVVFGSDPPWSAVNAILGTAFTYDGEYASICLDGVDPECVPTPEAANTEFAGGPASLAYLDDTSNAPNGGYPENTVVIYEDPFTGDPALFVSPIGNGGLVFFAFDWFAEGDPVLQAPWDEVLGESLAVNVSVGDVAVTEGQTAQFVLSLDETASQDVVVLYSTGNGTALDGTDYTGQASTAVIPAGQDSITVDVPTLVQAGEQGTRDFVLQIETPFWGLTSDAEGVATITDLASATTTTTTAAPQAVVTPRFTG